MSTKNFFSGYAPDFDSIYGDGIFDRKRSIMDKTFDRMFRTAMRLRFNLVDEAIKNLEADRSVLDAGCGGGVYLHCIAAAEPKKIQYTGFDFAETMVSLAKLRAERLGIESQTKISVDSIESFESQKTYDLVIAMGFFDYMKNPAEVLEKLCDLSNSRVIFSIPKAEHWLSLQRKIRYRLRECDLYLYSSNQLKELIDPYRAKVIDCGRDWVVEISTAETENK